MERITLNIIPKGITPICHASQFDIGRRIALDLMDGLQGYTLSDEEITLRVCKPDMNIVTAAVDVTPGKTYVIIETTEQMTAVEGDNACELKITKDGAEIGSLNFKMRVEQDPLKDGIESETEIHNLEAQIEELVANQYDSENVIFDDEPTAGHGIGYTVTSEGVKTALDEKANTDDLAPVATSGDYNDLDNLPTIPENLPDLGDVEITSPTAGQIIEYDDNDNKWKNVANPASTTNFGAPYDENTTYNVPSLVIYNNLLYKLNDGEDGTTGPWDPTKWTQTSVAELAQLIGSLSSLATTNKNSLVDAVNEVNANKADTSYVNNQARRTFQVWGSSLTTNYGRNHWFVIVNDAFYIVWFAGDTDVRVRNVGSNTLVTGTNSATIDSFTFTRQSNLVLRVSLTGSATITAIG